MAGYKISIWSRLDDRGVGVAAVWREEAHTPPPWKGASAGAAYHPKRRAVGWARRRSHLGRYKEVFNPGLYALHRSLGAFDDTSEHDCRSTVFLDSAAA